MTGSESIPHHKLAHPSTVKEKGLKNLMESLKRHTQFPALRWVWTFSRGIPGFGRLMEDQEFQAILGYRSFRPTWTCPPAMWHLELIGMGQDPVGKHKLQCHRMGASLRTAASVRAPSPPGVSKVSVRACVHLYACACVCVHVQPACCASTWYMTPQGDPCRGQQRQAPLTGKTQHHYTEAPTQLLSSMGQNRKLNLRIEAPFP